MSEIATDELRGDGLTALLDTIIPPSPERGLPGAGEIGLAGDLDAELPGLRPSLRQGLASLHEKARARGAARFSALAAADRGAALAELTDDDPGFLPGIVYHTYLRYYRHARVLEALGLEARPPYPRGYELAPTDPERLAAMRSRPAFYRDC